MKTFWIVISTIVLLTSLQAQELLSYSGDSKALSERWQWAVEKADKAGYSEYWVAYTFEHLMSANSYVGNFSRYHKDDVKLGELLYPGSPKDYFESLNYQGNTKDAKKVNKELAILFRFKKDKIIESEISTIDMYFDLENKPVLWLGLSGEEESIQLIIEKYENIGNPEAKESLISAAGMHKKVSQSFDFLKGIIENEKDNELREDAVFWLGQLDNPKAIPFLKKIALNDRNEDVAEKAVFSLYNIKSEQTLDVLMDLAKNVKNSEVREKAIFWLGQLENPETIPFLKDIAMNDPNEDVAEKAVFALYDMKSEKTTDILIDLAKNVKNREVREKAIFWLGQLAGKKAVIALDDIVYSDEETDIQKKAVFALSQLDNGKGVPKLIKIAKTHPNPQIRKKAIFWLGESEDDRALDALIDMVQK
jgi:HEAT repeat protein